MKARVVFAEARVKRAYERTKTRDPILFKWLNRAFDDLAENPYCGIFVPKRLIPKDYIKRYEIDNLWKYDLPKGWRLLYSIAREEVLIVTIILEWLSHPEYERKFGY
jgi:hypothetical protein